MTPDRFQSRVAAIVTQTTRGEKAIVIVYVAFADKKEFEKYIEGHALVLGYSAEAQVAGTDPKDWTKP